MTNRNKLHASLPALVAGALLLTAGHAHAQSVDYASLQDLFGEPITTNATGTPQRASEVAANMTIITADQIRQSGSRQIPEIIGMYVAGIDVLREGPTGYDVGVRGYQQPQQPRLLVLMDGRQIFIDDYSRTVWDNIPVNIDDIRQIEVVKGPASALFGSNADGGVINIITYNPYHDHNRVADLNGGTQNTLAGDATATFNGAWGGTKFSAGGLTGDNFHTAINTSDIAPFRSSDHRYVTNSSVFQITPDIQANAEFTISDSTALSSNATLFNIYSHGATTYSLRGGAVAQTDIGQITSNTYFNHSLTRLYLTNPSGPPVAQTTSLLVSQLEDQFKTGTDHTFRVGLEYRHKNYSTDGQLSLPSNAGLSVDNYAVSGTWLWQIANGLSWTNAARLDHQFAEQTGSSTVGALVPGADYSHAINEWSANSGLVYTPTTEDTIRLTFGRGVDMPSLINSGFQQATQNSGLFIDVEANPKLKPTLTNNYELGYDRKIPEIFSTAKFSAFYQVNQDVISSPSLNGSVVLGGNNYLVLQSLNIGNSRGYGGEMELQGGHNGFRWNASYSFVRIMDDQSVADSENYQGSTPNHYFRLNLGYTRGSWEFDGHGEYVTAMDMRRGTSSLGTTTIPTSGYLTLGGRVGYNITDYLTLALSGMGLNRETITQSPYPAVERQAFLTLTGKF